MIIYYFSSISINMKTKYHNICRVLLFIVLSGLLSSCNFCQTMEQLRQCFANKKAAKKVKVKTNLDKTNVDHDTNTSATNTSYINSRSMHKDRKLQTTKSMLHNTNNANHYDNATTNATNNMVTNQNQAKQIAKNQPQDFQNIESPTSKEERDLTIAMLECLANKENDVYAMYRLGEIYLNGLWDIESKPVIAYDWFYKAAIRSFSKAMLQLGNMYLKGIGTDLSVVKSIEWYIDAAKLGNIESMLTLGYLYKSGYLDISVDYEKAIYWYSKAANMGSYEAQYHIAQLSEQETIGKPKSPISMNTAIGFLKKAVEEGDLEAKLMLAEHYLNTKEYSLSLMYYQQAADQNHSKALLRLGLLYLHGEIIPKDYAKAIKFLTMAASASETNAQYYLGEIYRQGLGVGVNMQSAAFWYSKAANKNSIQALVKLGDLYFFGKGVEPNLYQAIDLYTKAANLGNSYARLLLSIFYAKGTIVSQDLSSSVHWFNLVKDKEDKLLAQFNIGRLYEIGYGFKKDLKEAVKWYLLSAQGGYAKAQAKLGDLHVQGINGKPDYKQAIEWYQKAAKQGYSYAEYSLGLLLQNKLLQNKEIRIYNPRLASVFMQRAAVNSYRPAQYSLGVMYLDGIGVQVNPIKAYAWLVIALHDTYESNPELIDVLINQLDAKAREQAVLLEKRYKDRYKIPQIQEF